MTKRESKVRAADQIVRLNPDIFGDVILRASDISLLIDTAGLILEVIYNTENKNLGDIEHWRTRNIRDFITKESGIKLEEILNLSSTENEKIEKDIIQLNHIKNGGDDFPIQYSIHPTGVNNQILLFGRDLTQIAQAQQELMKTQLKFEREYDRYRSFDTKYRVILEQCGSAFIIVDEAGQLIDFNQKAVAILEKADLNQMMLKDLFYQGISIDILSELETLNKNTPSTALNLNVKETNKENSICLQYDDKKTTFVDIGSNEGIWAFLLRDKYDFIHSFEPIKNNFNHLKHNLSDFLNVKVYNCAISDKIEKFEMVNGARPSMIGFNCGMTARKENFKKAIREFNNFSSEIVNEMVEQMCYFEMVNSNTLDSYSFKPSLIKIDVENDEIRVLNGARKTIEKYSPVLYVENNFKPVFEELKETILSMDYVAVPEHPWIHIRK